MLPSYTVENYLKAILQAQIGLSRNQLVPMGQLASALGVVPGTATTMVKALAESGLVKYEPYAGVRLTAAGEKLAAMVLRRHRLIELFLVKVMGMSWTEVHDEAEHLEHAVSDRLIERIDEMLGRPSVDPHGDPIPDQHGAVDRREYDTLLTCPLGARVTVSRVTDQDTSFLRFVERHHLKPGSTIRVEERDTDADSVRLLAEGDKEITIGARAASKVLVQAVQVMLLCLLPLAAAFAQTPAPSGSSASSRPFGIIDNSFLVEEAFNQEPGIFQSIFGFHRSSDAWAFAFTQEWPVGSLRHQFSYTLPWAGFDSTRGFGDAVVNYRYQLVEEDPGIPAISPRLSLVLPTGSGELSYDAWGLQANIPGSKQFGDYYLHANVGFTWFPKVTTIVDRSCRNVDCDVALFSPHLAASAIYRVRDMFNVMLEGVLEFEEVPLVDSQTTRDTVFTLSPGFRGGWNLGDHQLIVGAAVPITWVASDSTAGILLYLSYELPFRR
jgi:DtxR family Mn-dependent transcriptional regulator